MKKYILAALVGLMTVVSTPALASSFDCTGRAIKTGKEVHMRGSFGASNIITNLEDIGFADIHEERIMARVNDTGNQQNYEYDYNATRDDTDRDIYRAFLMPQTAFKATGAYWAGLYHGSQQIVNLRCMNNN